VAPVLDRFVLFKIFVIIDIILFSVSRIIPSFEVRSFRLMLDNLVVLSYCSLFNF
jgi:hypothetical protein